MPVAYNFKPMVDLPLWQWLSFMPAGQSYHGTSNVYDGQRYMYWAIMYGSTSNAAATSQLWRYDLRTNGWQYLATLTSGAGGMDLEYDSVRNVLYVMIGAGGTALQCFNLNTTAVTVNNVSCAPFALTTLGALPAVASLGASLTMPDSASVPATIDAGITAPGSTATVITDTASSKTAGTFGPGMIGLQLRFTSGVLSGQRRLITAATQTSLTVNAFGSAPGSADTFVVELPTGTFTAGSTTGVLNDTGLGATVNQYANNDVLITSGPLSGQRRRIASNTATALTLAGAVTGNARTQALASAPAAGDAYQIVPSQDFLYYQPGNNTTTLFRLDVVQTTGSAWSATMTAAPGGIGSGSNTLYPASYAPFSILAFRANATANVYIYDTGLNSWRTITTFPASEVFNVGCSVALVPGRRKLFIQKDSSQRCYFLDLTTGLFEPAGFMPYATPGAYDGKRARFIKTPDGVEYMYLLRAGGQEFFRVPLEWL